MYEHECGNLCCVSKRLFERLPACHCSCCSADACAGVAWHRLVDSLQAHVPLQPLNSTAVQSSPVQFTPVQSSPVQSSLVRCSLKCHLSAFVFSSPLGLCCSPTRFTKWTVSGLVLSPLAICSGKIHYSPGESCSALSLHRVYAAAGSIFTLESRTTPSLSCKHIWNLCCTLQHWWLQSYCVITIAILLCRG